MTWFFTKMAILMLTFTIILARLRYIYSTFNSTYGIRFSHSNLWLIIIWLSFYILCWDYFFIITSNKINILNWFTSSSLNCINRSFYHFCATKSPSSSVKFFCRNKSRFIMAFMRCKIIRFRWFYIRHIKRNVIFRACNSSYFILFLIYHLCELIIVGIF